MKSSTKVLSISLALAMTVSIGSLGLKAKADGSTEKPVLKSTSQYTAPSATQSGYQSIFSDCRVKTSDGGQLASIDQTNDKAEYGNQILVKYQADGKIQWQKDMSDGRVISICETSDGNYFVSCVAASGEEKLYKFSASGNEIFSKSLDKAISDLTPDSDGGAYCTSDLESISKIDADGSIKGIASLPANQNCRAVQFANGKLYVLVCENDSPVFTVFTLSTDGAVLSQKQLPKNTDSTMSDYFTLLKVTSDGGYMLVKVTEDKNSNSTVVIGKFDANLNDQWTMNIDDTTFDFDVNSDGTFNTYSYTDNESIMTKNTYAVEAAGSDSSQTSSNTTTGNASNTSTNTNSQATTDTSSSAKVSNPKTGAQNGAIAAVLVAVAIVSSLGAIVIQRKKRSN